MINLETTVFRNRIQGLVVRASSPHDWVKCQPPQPLEVARPEACGLRGGRQVRACAPTPLSVGRGNHWFVLLPRPPA